MFYNNDPREMIKDPETGFMLEDDNRKEEKYIWSGKILDLCDLPVEEYMKPMTVIALGSVSPDTGTTQYTLKFVIDGVTVGQEKIASGDAIPFNIAAEKEGRNFLGWYYGSTKYEEGALMPSKNLTLTAKYECDVKFVFVIDGVEEEVSAYTVAYNTVVTNIPTTNKEGYNFLGWEPSVKNNVIEHTIFKGTFEPIVYKVTWIGYVDGPIAQEYKYNDVLIQPVNPEKEGYTFKNWDKEIPTVVTSDIQFNAVFEINKYQIVYIEEYNGKKTQLSAFTLDYGTTIPKHSIPSENGYTYSDWKSDYTGTKVPAFDIEYVSIKTINSYTLSYFVNGIGDSNAVNVVVYEYMAPIENYTFEKEGYYPVTSWDGLPTHMPYNDLKVYGSTEIMKFTVEFVDEEGNVIKKAENVIYGTIVESILPSDTVEFEYTFDENDIIKVVKEDLTINVVKTKKQYIVTFVNNGVEEKVSLEYGVSINEYVEKTYVPEEGYYREFTTTHETVPGSNEARVEIVYKPNILTLSYSTTGAGDKNINGEIKVAFNDTILDKLPEGILEGYNFSGWFNGENKVTELDVMPNNNVSVNGTYEVIMLHVNVKDGETVVLSKDYAYGTSISEVVNDNDVVSYIAELDKNGYVGTLNLNGVEVIKSDLEFQIERTEKEYVLAFMNGETLISSALVKFNSIIEYPEMSGYTENGVEFVFTWNDNSYDGKPMPAMNVTIVGNYVEKPTAPIYFGCFKVAKSAYTPDNTTQYFDESKIGTEYYGSVDIKDCFGTGTSVMVPIIADPDMKGMNAVQKRNYLKIWTQPVAFLLPADLTEKYEVELLNGANINSWPNYKTDNQIVNLMGNEFKFYVFYNEETLNPVATSETLNYTLKLNEK